MAEFLKVIKERKRMSESYEGCCKGCPLEFAVSCHHWMLTHPEETEEIIMRWSEEHPIITNRKKFEEVFGFNIASLFDVNNCSVAEWLDDEYKEKIANE